MGESIDRGKKTDGVVLAPVSSRPISSLLTGCWDIMKTSVAARASGRGTSSY